MRIRTYSIGSASDTMGGGRVWFGMTIMQNITNKYREGHTKKFRSYYSDYYYFQSSDFLAR